MVCILEVDFGCGLGDTGSEIGCLYFLVFCLLLILIFYL